MQDIHDIRPPVATGFDPVMIKMAVIGLGCLLLAWLLFFLIRKWRKKRKGVNPADAVAEPLSPFEEALNALGSLLQNPMNDPRLFYYDLTFVLRQYMGRSFSINAVEMTSEEFVRETGRLDLAKEIKKDISYFQALSDPFKYAGVQAEKTMVAKDLDAVREIVSKVEKDLERKRQEKQKTVEKKEGA
ncbi:MAG: hypothetical protein A2277_10685 [Desulfobacterales bacterium RIFOXYA12_FULL_46_15]|nr:MAG: hypothetical protein A2277_10685 [Desulfobacterales bacterium RIFOXYA12_FULL_46_15]